ncbi:MAG: hypothetical protein J6A79_02435 [Clostridia bacterium]|nr:hypothetical protein [Clostridia bacterium]
MKATEDVRVDPSLVPDCEYDLICASLYASISAALSDPKLRAEYEEWKKNNAAKNAAERKM